MVNEIEGQDYDWLETLQTGEKRILVGEHYWDVGRAMSYRSALQWAGQVGGSVQCFCVLLLRLRSRTCSQPIAPASSQCPPKRSSFMSATDSCS